MAVTAQKSPSTKHSPSPGLSGHQNRDGAFSGVESDIVVEVDGVGFALHKFPLLSRSGRIKKLVSDYRGPDPFQVALPNVPGGADAFELAAKFCYGIKFEITTSNVALLRCVAEYLEMTEEYGERNLIVCSELFLKEGVLQSLEKSVQVLCACQNILLVAEEIKIVSRCIDAIASKACNDQIASTLSNYNNSCRPKDLNVAPQAVVEWWADDLSILRIDLFQQVLMTMKSRGLRVASIAGALMQYTQKSLRPLNKRQSGLQFGAHLAEKEHDSDSVLEHAQRVVVETIVSLLPAEKNIVPTAFLFGLLRTAIILDTTVACRLDLEMRIGAQLEQATLEELLIPSLSHTGDTLFDADIVHRLLFNFLQQEDNDNMSDSHQALYESDGLSTPSQMGIMRVIKLIDMYLAEIAPDANLKVSKFIGLAELLPDYARVVDDGIYRAIDIYLKAHPAVSDLERKKICKLMDCQKLSQEACTHAAQNERLPVQVMVQVLYFEQLRLRKALSSSNPDCESLPPLYMSQRTGSGTASATMSPRENYASLRRENQDLRLEVSRMKMKLNDLEKEHVMGSTERASSTEKPSSSSKFISSVSRTLSRINPFARNNRKDSLKQQAPQVKTPRSRRHSIS